MSTQNRRSLGSSSAAKRHAVSSENIVAGKATAVPSSHLTKKRPPFSNLTNQTRSSVGKTITNVPCPAAKTAKPKKSSSTILSSKTLPPSSSTSINNTTLSSRTLPPPSLSTKPNALASCKTSLPKKDDPRAHPIPPPSSSNMDISPPWDKSSFSMDESTSTCDSLKSPEVEYIDAVSTLSSIERKTSNGLHISGQVESEGNVCKRVILTEIEMKDDAIDVDDNFDDPQFCATIAGDIYKHLRSSEIKKRPSTDYMEKIQKDINASMRAILIDWLVEVSEEYRLVPDTLYLTINYIDRYLSGNSVNRQRLQLLGVACMMIAAKYEEICAPQVEEFCYITDNTYFKDEVLQMESTVLNFLKFEMTAPTAKCFLRRFVRAAQANNEASPLQLECLANYITELSLLEYSMLQYAPSVIAASAIFLANYIILPKQKPWNATLRHYTLYEPSHLRDCVKALHQLCLDSHSSSLPAIKDKYSQHKYKFVAKKYCPPAIPADYFENVRS